jgi:hypothetical protein
MFEGVEGFEGFEGFEMFEEFEEFPKPKFQNPNSKTLQTRNP